MYNTSTGLIIGVIFSLILNLGLGISIKEYKPNRFKRKKYKTVRMKIKKIKKVKPKKIKKIVEVKKVDTEIKEPKKKEVKKKVVKKKIKKKIKKVKKKKVVKKKEPIKKKIEVEKKVAKNPINKDKKVTNKKKSSKPIFGVSMTSVSKTGGSGGFNVQVGNTLMTDYKTGWENGKPKEVGTYDPDAVVEKKKEKVKKVAIRPKLKIKKKAIPKKVFRPKYTKAAKDAEIEGKVVLKLTIAKNGSVASAKIIKGLGYGLDEEVLKVIKSFIFEPAILSNGKKTATVITYTITFVLED